MSNAICSKKAQPLAALAHIGIRQAVVVSMQSVLVGSEMPIKLPIVMEMDLLGARQIVRSLAPLKGLTGDDAEIVARIIAQSFAEGHQRVAASPSEGWRNE